MSEPLDLVGKRFGKLKAICPLRSRGRAGVRLWLCLCDCGNKTHARAAVLRNGHKKSCGCLARSSWRNAPFTKAKTRAALVATERVRDENGDWWFALREAARYLNLRRKLTLAGWAVRCPYLNGAAIETRELPGAYNRTDTYYSKRDLDRMKKAMAGLVAIPTYPGLVHFDKACSTIGVTGQTLHSLLKRHGEEIEYRPGKCGRGHAIKRPYVSADFVETAKAERAGSADRLSLAAAGKLLGLPSNTVSRLVRNGVLPRLEHEFRKNDVLVSRSAVEALKRKRELEDTAKIAAPGRWEDVRTLARTHRMKVRTITHHLRQWVLAGALQYKVGCRWRTNPRRRTRVRLYDADAVVRMLPLARGGKPTPLRSGPADPMDAGKVETNRSSAVAGRRGRPRDPVTAEVYQFCYEEYCEKKRPASAVRCAAVKLFGAKAPKEEADVIRNARRHANRHNLPWR